MKVRIGSGLRVDEVNVIGIKEADRPAIQLAFQAPNCGRHRPSLRLDCVKADPELSFPSARRDLGADG